MATRTKKAPKTAIKEQTPMQDYIQQRLITMNEGKFKRTAVSRLVGELREGRFRQERIEYTDKQRHEVAMTFKRLFCCLRALAFLYGKYAGALRDHSAGLCDMGLNLRKIISSFTSLEGALVDADIAINRMWRECVPVEGLGGDEVDMQNDEVLQAVFEVAMNCDDRGRELEEETVLVRMPKKMYDTFCIGSPLFAKLDMYGGQWDLKKKKSNKS